jgi:hypothetical protein
MHSQRNNDSSDNVSVTHTTKGSRSEAVTMIDSSDFLNLEEVSHVV